MRHILIVESAEAEARRSSSAIPTCFVIPMWPWSTNSCKWNRAQTKHNCYWLFIYLPRAVTTSSWATIADSRRQQSNWKIAISFCNVPSTTASESGRLRRAVRGLPDSIGRMLSICWPSLSRWTLRKPSREMERTFPLLREARTKSVMGFLWLWNTVSSCKSVSLPWDQDLDRLWNASSTEFPLLGRSTGRSDVGTRPAKRGGWGCDGKSCLGIWPNSSIWISYMWRCTGSLMVAKSTDPGMKEKKERAPNVTNE